MKRGIILAVLCACVSNGLAVTINIHEATFSTLDSTITINGNESAVISSPDSRWRAEFSNANAYFFYGDIPMSMWTGGDDPEPFLELPLPLQVFSLGGSIESDVDVRLFLFSIDTHGTQDASAWTWVMRVQAWVAGDFPRPIAPEANQPIDRNPDGSIRVTVPEGGHTLALSLIGFASLILLSRGQRRSVGLLR